MITVEWGLFKEILLSHPFGLYLGLEFEGFSPPFEITEQLLAKFTEKQGVKRTQHVLSTRMKDKIRLHLLVLCLLIDDFSVELSTLQKDLKISTNK